jgi:hypothetical protein
MAAEVRGVMELEANPPEGVELNRSRLSVQNVSIQSLPAIWRSSRGRKRYEPLLAR